MPHAMPVRACDLHRIAAAVRDVPGVEAQPHERRIGVAHETRDLFGPLDVARYVRMERGDESALACVARDRVHAVAEPPPLAVAETGRPIRGHTAGDRRSSLIPRNSSTLTLVAAMTHSEASQTLGRRGTKRHRNGIL